MHFQISTDYAVRILYYLHQHKTELPTAMVIAQDIGVTYPFFIKVANRLKQKGLITAVQGRNGGYRLARDAEKITMYDVLLAMEGELKINRCMQDDKYCSKNDVDRCMIHLFFYDLQQILIDNMKKKCVADF